METNFSELKKLRAQYDELQKFMCENFKDSQERGVALMHLHTSFLWIQEAWFKSHYAEKKN